MGRVDKCSSCSSCLCDTKEPRDQKGPSVPASHTYSTGLLIPWGVCVDSGTGRSRLRVRKISLELQITKVKRTVHEKEVQGQVTRSGVLTAAR